MNQSKYRNTWLRWYKGYERTAFRNIYPVIRGWGNNIEWDKMNVDNYQFLVKQAIKREPMEEAYLETYEVIGYRHGVRTGRGINQELKNFTIDAFNTEFYKAVLLFFKNYGISRVVSISDTYYHDIIKLMDTRLVDGIGMEETIKEMQRIVNSRNFYRWQAMRIARTETTASANFGAIESGKVSGYVMEKVWISARDTRTRRKPEDKYDHYHMNGVKVPQDGVFVFNESDLFGADKLEYPGDPKGKAGNLANCRCSVGIVPKRDENGNLVKDDTNPTYV